MWRWPRARVSQRWRNRPSVSTSAPARSHRGKRGLRAKPEMYSAPGDNATALPAVDVESSDASIGEFTLGNVVERRSSHQRGTAERKRHRAFVASPMPHGGNEIPSLSREPLAIGIEYVPIAG